MSSIRKLVSMAGVFVAASSLLVGCSDDDYPKNVMGAIVVNSLQTTSNSATAYWTIVSNGSTDGYKVVINEGTREAKGAEVVNQTFEPKVYHSTFSGLKENTSYVITTQAIPSKSSGRDKADTYEMQFVTAPLVHNISLGEITYAVVIDYDKEGNEVRYVKGSVNVSWDQIVATNCGGYTANFEGWILKDTSKPESDSNPYQWTNLKSETLTGAASNSVKFANIIDPNTKYRVRVRPNPSNACWYPQGEFSISSEVTAPAAPEGM